MKRRALVMVVVACLGVTVAWGDAGVAERVPGKYELTVRGKLLRLKAVKSYHPDGRYESIGKASILGIERELVHRGTWKLENGYLVYTLTESSTPKEAPPGVPLKFKVLSHDGTLMKYKNEEKDESYVEKRIGAAGS